MQSCRPARPAAPGDFINPLQFDGAKAMPQPALAAGRQTAPEAPAHNEGVPTVDANDNCGDWTSEFKALVHCCLALPADAGRMAKLSAPRRRDFPVVKLRHFAFYAAPLELLPEHLHRKRLIVTGLSVLKFDKVDDARPQDKDEWPAGA